MAPVWRTVDSAWFAGNAKYAVTLVGNAACFEAAAAADLADRCRSPKQLKTRLRAGGFLNGRQCVLCRVDRRAGGREVRQCLRWFSLRLSSWRRLPAAAQYSVSDLSHLRNYESERSSSYDRTGGNDDSSELKSGQELTLFDETGPAEIRHIWITVDDPEAYHLKKIVLRMYWDGEKTPSVEVPLGDFFGLGWAITRYSIPPLLLSLPIRR